MNLQNRLHLDQMIAIAEGPLNDTINATCVDSLDTWPDRAVLHLYSPYPVSQLMAQELFADA